ncbi:hypothetical protein OPQ81_004974 [Rhizoctonia solani]|nr:hypothetical protein OPQ81_004974 [Rhizoctonia solani]
MCGHHAERAYLSAPGATLDSLNKTTYLGLGILKAVWFLIGGVAVVCLTEKLGTKRREGLPWEAEEWHKLQEKKLEHLRHVISCHGAQWAAMHKDRSSSNREKML